MKFVKIEKSPEGQKFEIGPISDRVDKILKKFFCGGFAVVPTTNRSKNPGSQNLSEAHAIVKDNSRISQTTTLKRTPRIIHITFGDSDISGVIIWNHHSVDAAT